ncbi:hypothetical protein PIB30_097674 [Stylosanthes scabra]|uniref:Uncharacterized protein n=1 Tax=Stylosanthes scabra TaxID=79078 RepID=A0ABU6UYR1_9FABA|nr:hypothetical protein [Stylosanthes scabra]
MVMARRSSGDNRSSKRSMLSSFSFVTAAAARWRKCTTIGENLASIDRRLKNSEGDVLASSFYARAFFIHQKGIMCLTAKEVIVGKDPSEISIYQIVLGGNTTQRNTRARPWKWQIRTVSHYTGGTRGDINTIKDATRSRIKGGRTRAIKSRAAIQRGSTFGGISTLCVIIRNHYDRGRFTGKLGAKEAGSSGEDSRCGGVRGDSDLSTPKLTGYMMKRYAYVEGHELMRRDGPLAAALATSSEFLNLKIEFRCRGIQTSYESVNEIINRKVSLGATS